MKVSAPIEKHHGRYLPWAAGSAAFLGLAGTLWALSEALENDTDGDGWTDAEEIIAGTNPADETDPWDSDGDGIADYLEFADGTDPLDPNDPPRIRKSVLTYSVAVAGDEATNISLESLKSGSQQNMYHNTAWFGKRLNYTFFRPTADSKWKAINGNEIEYWSTGYYDLLARNGSSGIAITVENVPSGKYTLKWKHMQRPDGGSTGYTVSVSGAATASKRFTAPKSNSEGEVHEASLTFEVSERGTLVLSFDAGSSGTSGPLVGSIALCEAFEVIKVDWDADIGGQEFKVTQDSGTAFTGSDWESSRKRQADPVAFQSGSDLKLIPTFNNPGSSPPTAIVDAIYAEFTDRDVRRVSDGKQMTYWKDHESGATTSDLLRTETANGNCQSWSGLFRDTICLQGIPAKRIRILPKRTVELEAGLMSRESVLVKNWLFGSSASTITRVCSTEPDNNISKIEYTHVIDLRKDLPENGTAVPGNILPGQGNLNTPSNFNGHWITSAADCYYDPSYGTEKVPITSPQEYENNAFSGFYIVDITGNFCRMNPDEIDVTYTLDTDVD